MKIKEIAKLAIGQRIDETALRLLQAMPAEQKEENYEIDPDTGEAKEKKMKPISYFPHEITIKVKRCRQQPDMREVGWAVELYGKPHKDSMLVPDNTAELCSAINLMAEQASAVVSSVIKYTETDNERN